MAEGSSGGNRKRPFLEDEGSSKAPEEKRVKFPKGKKSNQGEDVTNSSGKADPSSLNPELIAKKRAKLRKKRDEENLDDVNELLDVRVAEVQYEDEDTLVEEDVAVEPFNLDKEREEGYFDNNGNYVEYVNQNEIKDAWLDSVDVCQKYNGKSSAPSSNDDQPRDLSTGELAEINRRIADVLEPGETVLRALRRLKGSSDKKQKMSPETKQRFDQLTEDAMKLMGNGDYNVYEEKQESFAREAEGYEKLVNARSQQGHDDFDDMFADDEMTAGNVSSNGDGSASTATKGGDVQSDYVYDESSGYYYSSSLGYYYDPSSGLYCSAGSGKWYSYNEQSGAYDEIQQVAQ